MKTISQYAFILMISLGLFLTGCQEEYEMKDLTTPTGLTLTYEIVGADAENPNGDGSGMVNFTATASNTITYHFDFGDGRDIQISPNGKITHQFAVTGVNTYHVTVSAVGTGGITSSKTDQVEVLSTFQDEEALQFLTGGGSKSWYWAADQPAHAGLGPTNEDYGNLEYTWPNWWQIGPWDAEKACMYDAEFVFTQTDNGMTFEMVSGPAWVPGAYAPIIGVEGDLCYGEDVIPNMFGVKNAAFIPSSSKASIDGEYRGTSISISESGFLGWWVGSSEYDIIEVTENVLRVRIKQDDTYAWYHIFTSTKPVQ